MTRTGTAVLPNVLSNNTKPNSTNPNSTNLEHSADKLPVTSSVPYELPAEQEALFRDVLSALESRNVSYAVSGAIALQAHSGICRCTKDLDIFLSPSEAGKALQYLSEAGFRCEVLDPIWLAKAHRGDFFVDLITGMSNGVITVDATWITRARAATIAGVDTRVLAPEELLASKLFVTRRERFDGADIAHIIYSSQGRLDWSRILELAGEHWEIVLWALMLFRYVYPANTDYVPRGLWQNLLAKFNQEVSAPNPAARFRGSLIDDKMFAIDVNEWGQEDLLSELRARSPKIDMPESCV